MSQEKQTPDELFKLARTTAFDQKDYTKALELLNQALVINPEYLEIHTFKGRLYNWSNKPDSARIEFNHVLSIEPGNEDAISAYFDLEFQRNNLTKALELAEHGITSNPESEELLIRKAKALKALGRSIDALKITSDYLIKHPDNKEVITLNKEIKYTNFYNSVSAGYSFAYFDKRFNDPWHLAYLSAGTKTRYGSVNFIINYANRFNSNATEFELEAYPAITTGLYAYIGGGAQLSGSIYPKYRAGLSLYKSLPLGFEAEGGIRHLKFGTNTNVYIAGLLKYIGNSYIGVRSYFSTVEEELNKSAIVTFRSFLSDDRNDYIGGSLGTGISPDERSVGIFEPNALRSIRASIDYSRNISRQACLGISLNWANEEFQANTYGNQYTINCSILRRF
ncbi:MAG TPA: YaiO family outer membrane beta-barrel protein [Sphingobacteriaceae bacterium]